MEQKDLKEKFDLLVHLFKDYSFKDIIHSLFTISTWNNNSSAILKQLFYIQALLSLNEYDFQSEDKILNYNNFEVFANKIFDIKLEFPSLEDYCPEQDWGEIKFYNDNEYFNFFYGSEICNVYDYLKCFQLIHKPLKSFYTDNHLRNPNDDLKKFLELQNLIIKNIKTQQNNEFPPGHTEIPPRKFWKETQICLYYLTKIINSFNKDFLTTYSAKLGNIEQIFQNLFYFEEAFLQCTLLNDCFIVYDKQYFPIIPRRLNYILCTYWNNQLKQLIKHNVFSLEEYHLICNSINSFIRERTPKHINFINYFNKHFKNKDLQDISCSLIILKKTVILIHIINPLDKNKFKNIYQKYNTIKAEVLSKLKLSTEYSFKILLIDPIFNFAMKSVELPLSENIFFFPLVDFVQMLNEIDDFYSLEEQLEFLKNNPLNNSIYSISDKLAFYRENNKGAILSGGYDYNYLILDDANYGSNTRFESLKRKFEVFPCINYMKDPDIWHIISDDISQKFQFDAKTLNMCIKYKSLNNTQIFVKPLIKISHTTHFKILDNITDMIQDIFYIYEKALAKHTFFRNDKKLIIEVISHNEIKKNPYLKDLEHYIDNSSCWTIPQPRVFDSVISIYILYNEKLYFNALNNTNNCEVEVNLALDILDRLDKITPDKNLHKIRDSILKHKNDNARFAFNEIPKTTSFPEHWEVILPEQNDYIRVQNEMGKILKNAQIHIGTYTSDEAKRILKILKENLIIILENELKNIEFNSGIAYLVQQMDAYYNKIEQQHNLLNISTKHNVDYDRTQRFIKIKNESQQYNVIYRYLIEKFVHLNPTGNKNIDKGKLQFLLALTRWIIQTYQHSDIIHNALTALSVIVDENFTVSIKISQEMQNRQDEYLKNESENEMFTSLPLEMKFKDEDGYYSKLNNAMIEDFGFSFQLLVDLLNFLCNWGYHNNTEEKTYYIATIDEILSAMKLVLHKDDYDEDSLKKLINFLTIKPDDLTKIFEDNFLTTKECNEIPIYEYNKRFSRYMIRPLINIGIDKILWGPQSTYQAQNVWTKDLAIPRFPFGLSACKTKTIIQKQKEKRENELNNNTYNLIINNYSKYCDKNIYLHNRDRNGSHPEDLGDYDVLCYIPQKNIVLNIECKYFLKCYCIKDARRLLENIIAKNKKTQKSSLDKVLRREAYLKDNLNEIFKILNWPIPKTPIKIKSFYVVTESEIFNILIENPQNIEFINFRFLNSYIENL